MDTDLDGSSEVGLRQAHEAPQGGDVFTRFEVSLDQPLPDSRGNRALELLSSGISVMCAVP
jgi:hypothetical protein